MARCAHRDESHRSMLVPFAQMMIGFSLCAAALLLWASLTVHADTEQSRLSRASGVVLLGGLALLQWMHGQWLQQHDGWASSRTYLALLFVVAAAFFLFFRGALQP